MKKLLFVMCFLVLSACEKNQESVQVKEIEFH